MRHEESNYFEVIGCLAGWISEGGGHGHSKGQDLHGKRAYTSEE